MANRTDHGSPKHDPRTCNACSSLRHPALAAQGRALTKYLAARPFPRQAVTS
jgi:hypothetical protein